MVTTSNYIPQLTARAQIYDYNVREGEIQAKYRNALLAYTFKVDRTPDKIKETLFFLNKYGVQIIEAAWDRRYAKRMERIPTQYEEAEEGIRRPTKFKFDYNLVLSFYTFKDFFIFSIYEFLGLDLIT